MVPGVADVKVCTNETVGHQIRILTYETENKNLQPMYEYLHQRIRQYDDTHIIFFEPVTWDDFGVGFTATPGGLNSMVYVIVDMISRNGNDQVRTT